MGWLWDELSATRCDKRGMIYFVVKFDVLRDSETYNPDLISCEMLLNDYMMLFFNKYFLGSSEKVLMFCNSSPG